MGRVGNFDFKLEVKIDANFVLIDSYKESYGLVQSLNMTIVLGTYLVDIQTTSKVSAFTHQKFEIRSPDWDLNNKQGEGFGETGIGLE